MFCPYFQIYVYLCQSVVAASAEVVYARGMTIKNILLFVKNTPEAAIVANEAEKRLADYPVAVYRWDWQTPPPDVEHALCLVIGGDGTFLAAAHQLHGRDIDLAGINLGHLGFLTDLDATHLDVHLKRLLAADAPVETRPYFTCCAPDGCDAFINDVVIQRQPDEKMLHFSVWVNDQLVTTSRADGLVIATPTGSTAYNLSAGGPVLHPELAGLVLAPICPHTLTFRPVVIPAVPVTLRLESADTAALSMDGRRTIHLHTGDSVKVTASPHRFRLRHANHMGFFGVLRQKMNWA